MDEDPRARISAELAKCYEKHREAFRVFSASKGDYGCMVHYRDVSLNLAFVKRLNLVWQQLEYYLDWGLFTNYINRGTKYEECKACGIDWAYTGSVNLSAAGPVCLTRVYNGYSISAMESVGGFKLYGICLVCQKWMRKIVTERSKLMRDCESVLRSLFPCIPGLAMIIVAYY